MLNDIAKRRMERWKSWILLLLHLFSECLEKQNSIFPLPRRAPSPTRSGMAAWRSSDTRFIISHFDRVESRNDYFVIFDTHHVLVLGSRALLGDGFREHGVLRRRHPNILIKIKNSIKYFHSSLFSLFLLLTSSSNCLADGLSELWSENALTDWLGGLSISNNRTNINKINLFYIHWKRQIILLMSVGLLHLDGNIETKLRDVASYYTRWE